MGLLSERRFLIFTKRGPIEISFKFSHYIGLALTVVVGFSSIVYYSIIGISSAIDVAQKDIITEASANLNTEFVNDDDIKNVQTSVLNEIIKNEDVSTSGKINFESNISIPNQKNDGKKYLKNSKKIDSQDSDSSIINKKVNKTNQSSYETSKVASIDNEHNVVMKDSYNLEDDYKEEENKFFISPPKIDERVSNFRFISSLDNELNNLEIVFNKLEIDLKNPKLLKMKDLKKIKIDSDETNEDFLNIFRERLNLLSIYKDALEFIPLKPPMEHYYVTSKYGKRKHPVTKKWRFHHGIDLAGTWQENIRVSADGIVTFSGYHGSFGKVIRIKHNYGLATTYGHLSKILVKKGQSVSEGQIIGKMGKTGRVDGAHLHYEISVNGKSKDPAIYFKIGRMLLSRNSFKSIANSN